MTVFKDMSQQDLMRSLRDTRLTLSAVVAKRKAAFNKATSYDPNEILSQLAAAEVSFYYDMAADISASVIAHEDEIKRREKNRLRKAQWRAL